MEYRLLGIPVSGSVSIPVNEWTEKRVIDEIIKEVKGMEKEIVLLKKLVDEWEGKEVAIDI